MRNDKILMVFFPIQGAHMLNSDGVPECLIKSRRVRANCFLLHRTIQLTSKFALRKIDYESLGQGLNSENNEGSHARDINSGRTAKPSRS